MSNPSASQPASTKGFFGAFYDDPDPNDAELREMRRHQWRPISQNPFAGSENSQPSLNTQNQDNTTNENDDIKSTEKPPYDRTASTQSKPEPTPNTESNILRNEGPTWVNLFYDLAWTATFSSLTQNGQFNEPWDTVSYVAFFLVVWWLWASQALYSIHFYTNDWFHLGSIFLQLIIFGMLAATTQGYDVTTYILHSPGVAELDPKTTDEITDPDRYHDERMAKVSMKVIAVSVAINRVIHLIQHLRVLAYAHVTARKRGHTRVPWKLYIIPIGLLISIPLFISAWAVSASSYGRTVSGAKLKFVFWGAGLIVEIVSHVRMSRASWDRFSRKEKPNQEPNPNPPDSVPRLTESSNLNQNLPVPRSSLTLRSRLEAITTIILGEGINGIASTLYAVISAPGLGGPIVANVACAAFIVYFLAYLYFEGPTGHRDPKDKGRRQVYWLLLHLPFLLGIVLLLLGVKNQFLLTSFLSTAVKSFKGLDEVFSQENLYVGDPGVETNLPVKNYLLRRGISWSEEYATLIQAMTNNGTDPIDGQLSQAQAAEFIAWNMRTSLKIVVKIYETFMGGLGQVSKETLSKISQYNTDLTWPIEDYTFEPNPETDATTSMHYYDIITELLHANLQGARYIIALAGFILICLAALNLIHSRPRDRYQWAIILSRFVMGWVLLFLLLLNIGRYQTLWVWLGQEKQQAGVFRWLWAYWVLPTVALAFGTQVVVETILVWLASLRTEDPDHTKTLGQLARESLKQVVLKPFRVFRKSE